MADSDLIDFNVIEEHKENIQALPSGRSAKALAALYSPPLTGATHDIHSSKRAEFEKEMEQIDEADDPLDVYDRYVKWTLNAYPSAQATPQSQLLPLLERATKAFLQSPHYKGDPRYLRIWLQYIQLFSDAPRETFVFLARQGIGETLALFYEEFAAWLESAGRWTQAEEVYQLGLEKEARPTERLMRKFGEFERRKDAVPQDASQPSSPALSAVRPALAAKIDPFASGAAAMAGETAQASKAAGKKKGNKMAIFSDESEQAQSVLGSGSDGKNWDSIGSLASRKKENTSEAESWAGKTLKTGKTNTGVPKMAIFKSSSHSSNRRCYESSSHISQRAVNPKTGRAECVFVNLEAVYPDPQDPSLEFCFEELRARHRGWLQQNWAAERPLSRKNEDAMSQTEAAPAKGPDTQDRFEIFTEIDTPVMPETKPRKKGGFQIFEDEDTPLGSQVYSRVEVPPVIDTSLKVLTIGDENNENAPPSQKDLDLAKRLRREERANRTRRIKVMDVQTVKKETQTVQLNLASPTGPKIKRNKKVAEPTMTINTREAMDEIYGIFSQPVAATEETAEDDEEEDDSDDDEYTSGGESTTTGKISANVSEYGDETRNEILGAQAAQAAQEPQEAESEERTEVTGWSDFTTSKHVPAEADQKDSMPSQHSKLEVFQDNEDEENAGLPKLQDDELITPQEDDRTADIKYVPLPPEDYDPMTSQYRNPAHLAQNRLPFMTPIVERTESSLGTVTSRAERDYFTAKTPSRQTQESFEPIDEADDDGPWSSPFQSRASEIEEDKRKVLQPIRTKTTKGIVSLERGNTKPKPLGRSLAASTEKVNKGPIIQDQQCNPVDPALRETVLAQIRPPLTSYDGYYEHMDTRADRGAEIRKFARTVSKKGSVNGDKTASTLSLPPMLCLEGTDSVYTIKRELGAGAFAPVYLVERNTTTAEAEDSSAEGDENALPVGRMGKGAFSSVQRQSLEALKLEDNPPSAWEFYMVRQAHRRLGISRPAESIVHAHEMHIFRDEGYLIEQYRDQGTLLDLVNAARADPGLSGGNSNAGMDESLAMFFTVELLRTVEALHARGIIHGDLKGDNVLVRFDALPAADTSSGASWSAQYARDGGRGWSAKGITLIDFGRGIDMKVFAPSVQFIADWETSEHDCAEMKELRPWTFQVDYHGLAGLVHSLLFGKYMAVVADRAGAALGQGASKTYRIREGLKRYWQTQLWAELFSLLLNPLSRVAAEEGARLPLTRGLRAVREGMEDWLEANCEKGVGLKSLIRKMEETVARRKK